MFDIFRLFDLFHRGRVFKKKLIIYQKKSHFSFVQISHLSSFIIFCVLVLIYIMGKDIYLLYKYNWPKQSIPTFKKSVLSSSAARAASTSNLTGTPSRLNLITRTLIWIKKGKHLKYRWHPLICNTTEKNYSVHATSTTTRLTQLRTTLPIVPVELRKTKQLSPAGK